MSGLHCAMLISMKSYQELKLLPEHPDFGVDLVPLRFQAPQVLLLPGHGVAQLLVLGHVVTPEAFATVHGLNHAGGSGATHDFGATRHLYREVVKSDPNERFFRPVPVVALRV